MKWKFRMLTFCEKLTEGDDLGDPDIDQRLIITISYFFFHYILSISYDTDHKENTVSNNSSMLHMYSLLQECVYQAVA
jgi:hypothetical protein